jgi:leucyl aminopeptidase
MGKATQSVGLRSLPALSAAGREPALCYDGDERFGASKHLTKLTHDPDFIGDGQATGARPRASRTPPSGASLMPRPAPVPDLPSAPTVVRRERLSERGAAELDAILVMLSERDADMRLAELPQAQRWHSLRELASPAGAPRSTVLVGARETRAVLGMLPTGASVFEALTLAGRMLREVPAEAERIALLAPARDAGHEHTAPRDAAASASDRLGALLSAALAHAFELPSFRSSRDGRPSSAPRRKLRQVQVLGSAPLDLPYVESLARGNNLVRFLTALPANVLDAAAYRRFIASHAREHGLRLTWLDERTLARLGASAFLAVASGNAERTAGIAHLSYRPAGGRTGAKQRRRGGAASRGDAPDVALIGKGILFDTGGTNLKPHRAMLDMHTDMSGSAVALATLGELARANAPLAADAWLAITENRIGPSAYKPQDVVRAANGVTIQVIHTDAEGRMALADTLALAGRTRPRLMIDFATLTGTCIYALTERMSGIVTNEPRLTEALLAAGRASGERVWNFPFDADFDSDLESKVADVLQCSVESKGDHILAARFLSRFVPEGTPWVHVDLSSAVRSGGLAHVPTDVTGFGVRFALELLSKRRVLDELGAKR